MTSEHPLLPREAIDQLRSCYPETPGRLRHHLVDHPLLTQDAIARLAERLPASSVEYNPGDLPIGIAPDAVPPPALGIAETIRTIETNGNWMVLKRIEQDPAYAALLDQILAAIAPAVKPSTGPMKTREGFIFLSSANSVTPYHIDPEHNILFQIRGSKVMNVGPAGDPLLAPDIMHERYHLGGHRNLDWQDAFSGHMAAIALEPGDAVHMPVKAPHWVQNGPAVSISLSVTWRSGWSYREADARAFNAVLRHHGREPTAPGRFPAQNYAKAIAWRIRRRLGLPIPQ